MPVLESPEKSRAAEPHEHHFSRESTRVSRWLRLISSFLVGQSALQLVNVVTGFLLLRWMSVIAYAQYSSAFAFQSTLNLLVDLGFSTCIVALVGERGKEKRVVGEYIRCARIYRGRLFLLIGLGSAAIYPLLVQHQPWGLPTKALLWCAVVSSVFFQGRLLYSAPLLIHGKMRELYQSQLAPAMVRLGGFTILHFSRVLGGPAASWLGTCSLALQGTLYRKHAVEHIDEPESVRPEVAKEMRKYLAPLWPGMIFYAVQGQITVALITLFGKTQSVAEVAALGRLAQIFILLGMMNPVLIEPMIARTSKAKIASRVLMVCAAGLVMVTGIWLFCTAFPKPILWLLGPKYSNLGPDVSYIVLASCLGYMSGLMNMINAARRWIVWAASAMQITIVLFAQIFYVLRYDVATTKGVLIFGVVTSASALVAMTLVTLSGLIKTRVGMEGD